MQDISFIFTYSSLFFYLSVEEQRRNKIFIFKKIILYLNADSNCFHKCFFVFVIPNPFQYL